MPRRISRRLGQQLEELSGLLAEVFEADEYIRTLLKVEGREADELLIEWIQFRADTIDCFYVAFPALADYLEGIHPS